MTTYRNFLIIDRTSTHEASLQYIKQNNWKHTDGLFQHRNPNDKIIVCYPGTVGPQSEARTLSPTDAPSGRPDGAISLQVDGNNLLVEWTSMVDENTLRKHLPNLKAYIIQCIKAAGGDPGTTQFTLYWHSSIDFKVKNVANQCKILTQGAEHKYVFTPEDLDLVPPSIFGSLINNTWSSNHFNSQLPQPSLHPFVPQHFGFNPK